MKFWKSFYHIFKGTCRKKRWENSIIFNRETNPSRHTSFQWEFKSLQVTPSFTDDCQSHHTEIIFARKCHAIFVTWDFSIYLAWLTYFEVK